MPATCLIPQVDDIDEALVKFGGESEKLSAVRVVPPSGSRNDATNGVNDENDEL
jgi:hypothetical protein